MAKAKKKTAESKPDDQNPPTDPPNAADEDEAPVKPGGNPRDDMRAHLANKHKETRDAPPAEDAEAAPPGQSEEEADAEAERMRAKLEADAAAAPEGEPGEGEQAPPDDAAIPEHQPYSLREEGGQQIAILPDGREVPLAKLISEYQTVSQKEAAATQAFQEASRLRKEILEYNRRVEQQRDAQQPSLSEEQIQQHVDTLDELQGKMQEAMAWGDDENLAKLRKEYNSTLVKLATSNQGSNAPAQLDDETIARGIERYNERQRDEALGQAYIWYRDNNTDVSGVPENDAVFGTKLNRLSEENPSADPFALFEKALAETREYVNGRGGGQSNDMEYRRRLKQGAAGGAAPAGSVNRSVETDKTPRSSAIVSEADMKDPRYARMQEIMKSRGQGSMYGNVPIAGKGGNRV